MEVSIYFFDKDLKDSLKKYLKCYMDEKDKIIFQDFEKVDHTKFYTLTLKKFTP